MSRLLAFLWQAPLATGVVLTAPAWLPLVIVAYATGTAFIPESWALHWCMRRAGRLLHPARLRTALAGGRGTLILERPQPQWHHTRLWWADGAVSVDEDSEGDVGRFEKEMTHPSTGRALLVAAGSGEQALRRLLHSFPDTRVVKFCSVFIPAPNM